MGKEITLKTIKEKLLKTNPSIEVISDFKKETGKTKKRVKRFIKCRCKIDNYEWDAELSNLLNGEGCMECKKKTLRNSRNLSIEEVKLKLIKINNKIEILSDVYINAHTKLKCKCLIDGHEWEATWSNLNKGTGCPKCDGRIRLTLEEVKLRLKEINSQIEIISDKYINAKTKLKCKCLIDNNEWNTTWDSLSQGTGCPECKRINNCGENNPAWNSNKTQEERKIQRCYPEYLQFIKDTLKRDDYTCDIRRIRGCKLTIHHLNGYHWFKEGRTDINNAVTLCEEEHNLFHKLYGNRNNTKEQYYEFKELRLKQEPNN